MNQTELIEWAKASGYSIVTIEPSQQAVSFNPFGDAIIDEQNKQNGQDLDKTLRDLGFDGEIDFFNCLIKLDLSKPGAADAYEKWKLNDGTKQGLISIQ